MWPGVWPGAWMTCRPPAASIDVAVVEDAGDLRGDGLLVGRHAGHRAAEHGHLRREPRRAALDVLDVGLVHAEGGAGALDERRGVADVVVVVVGADDGVEVFGLAAEIGDGAQDAVGGAGAAGVDEGEAGLVLDEVRAAHLEAFDGVDAGCDFAEGAWRRVYSSRFVVSSSPTHTVAHEQGTGGRRRNHHLPDKPPLSRAAELAHAARFFAALRMTGPTTSPNPRPSGRSCGWR